MEKKAIFKVTGMHCSNCAMRLQSMEDDLPGVHQVDASYQKQQMVVRFDADTITENEIVLAAEKLGYPAELFQYSKVTYRSSPADGRLVF